MWTPRALQARGATAAQAGRVDTTAPVIATAHVVTEAPAWAVWAVLTDIQSWPDTIPDVTSARVDSAGVLAEGDQFIWVNNGATIRSTVEVLRHESELTWSGIALWLVAVHRNVIDTLPDGQTKLTSTESMSGLGAAFFMPERKLKVQLQTFVQAIANKAMTLNI